MSWSVKYNPALGIIEEVFGGLMTMSELEESVSQRICLEKETGAKKVLVDASDLTLDATIVEVYSLPNKLYEDQEASRLTHMALVLPTSPKTKEAAEFYQTACFNRGWKVEMFPDRESALNWLSKDNN